MACKNYSVWLLLAMMTWVGCSSESQVYSSTQVMANYLELKADTAYNSGKYPYFTDKLLHRLGASLKGMPASMRTSATLDYALVLILKGHNQKAISQVNQFLGSRFPKDSINRANSDFYRILALAYLREAEQQNCISQHGSQSCIIPLKGDGIHQQKEPAEQAKKYYRRLLAYDSEDYQSLWFYNLTHMATGTYPQEVEEAFLIAPDRFESEVDFPEFRNKAMHAGVAAMNHAGGSSLLDVNNDGWLDIFTSAYSLADPAHVYISDGKGGYQDKTQAMGIAGLTGGLNHVHADFNNDGWTDIFIMRGAWLADNGHISNSLLINTGTDSFEDKTRESGMITYKPTGAVAVSDINLDGELDIFIGNESTRDRNASEMYLNQGDGTFRDLAEELGLDMYSYVKGAVWGDINNDHWPDLYISNYSQPNRLFVNRKGRFEEIGKQAGVDEPTYSFTTWFWDYDQDGWQDLLVFGYDNRKPHLIADEITKEYLGKKVTGEYPRLYRNNGDETFTDVTVEAGLDRLIYAMGGNFGDLNNDGYPDFYAGTGEFNIWASIPNLMFLNQQGKSFADVTTAGGFGMIQKGHGVAFGDIDNDGDQDIYHQVGGAVESDVFHNVLFENPGFGHAWLRLKLTGTHSNRSAIGARVEVKVEMEEGEKSLYEWVGTGGSFGANSLEVEMGLGEAKRIKYVAVDWPRKSGETQYFYHLNLNHAFELIEDQEDAKKLFLKRFRLGNKHDHM